MRLLLAFLAARGATGGAHWSWERHGDDDLDDDLHIIPRGERALRATLALRVGCRRCDAHSVAEGTGILFLGGSEAAAAVTTISGALAQRLAAAPDATAAEPLGPRDNTELIPLLPLGAPRAQLAARHLPPLSLGSLGDAVGGRESASRGVVWPLASASGAGPGGDGGVHVLALQAFPERHAHGGDHSGLDEALAPRLAAWLLCPAGEQQSRSLRSSPPSSRLLVQSSSGSFDEVPVDRVATHGVALLRSAAVSARGVADAVEELGCQRPWSAGVDEGAESVEWLEEESNVGEEVAVEFAEVAHVEYAAFDDEEFWSDDGGDDVTAYADFGDDFAFEGELFVGDGHDKLLEQEVGLGWEA